MVRWAAKKPEKPFQQSGWESDMEKVNVFKKWREQQGLSQREVADALGMETCQMISNIERGLSLYPMKSIKKVAEIFNVQERQVRVEMFLFQENKLRKKYRL